jgi:hypothetical protein
MGSQLVLTDSPATDGMIENFSMSQSAIWHQLTLK